MELELILLPVNILVVIVICTNHEKLVHYLILRLYLYLKEDQIRLYIYIVTILNGTAIRRRNNNNGAINTDEGFN